MIGLVDLEKASHPDLGDEDKRSELSTGMFACVLATEQGRKKPHRLWLKISFLDVLDGDVIYVGELVSETFLDIELGHSFTFGPEHVLEWTTHM